MRSGHVASAGEVIGNIVSKTLWLAVGGGLIGLAFGITMRYILRWMRHLGAGIEQQVAMTFAIGYLSYYTANAPAHVSGACICHWRGSLNSTANYFLTLMMSKVPAYRALTRSTTRKCAVYFN